MHKHIAKLPRPFPIICPSEQRCRLGPSDQRATDREAIREAARNAALTYRMISLARVTRKSAIVSQPEMYSMMIRYLQRSAG